MATDWKPVNPCDKCSSREHYQSKYNKCVVSGQCVIHDHYKSLCQGQRKLLKYMDAPCDNPAHLVDNRDRVDASRVEVILLPTGKYKASYLHRKDCPTCMNELRGEK
jgi:hypothetical protein